MDHRSPYAPGAVLTAADVAGLVDHALLKPELTPQDVLGALDGLSEAGVWSVCVRPGDVADVAAHLREAGSGTRVCTVIGFPHGSTSTTAKVAESRQALEDGATELDMVLAIGRLRGGDHDRVRDDIAAVVEVAHTQDRIFKVILETSLLSDEQKETGCRLAAEAGADFVKTSTGFAGGGATVADVTLMRAATPEPIEVKASGGVRDVDTLLAMLAAGATRIGTSSTTALVAEAEQRQAEGTLVVPTAGTDPVLVTEQTGY